jgi:hypothetical protein
LVERKGVRVGEHDDRGKGRRARIDDEETVFEKGEVHAAASFFQLKVVN